MPQVIDVPGQGLVEFPDGMDDAAIVKAIKGLSLTAKHSDDPGILQAGLIGAGRATDKIVQGVRQLYNKAIGDQPTLDKMAADEAEKDRLYKPLQEAHPIATAVGETAPALAVPVAGAGGLLARTAIAGALPGLAEYGTADERIRKGGVGALGGAAGGLMGGALSRLLKPAGVGVEGLSGEALSAADRLGVKLSSGQRTQNPAMQGFENYLSKSPGSSGAMQLRAMANQSALNAAGSKAMGQRGGDLSEGAFSAAKDAIGNEFARLQSVTAPKLGNDFLSTLATIDSANAARGSFKSKSIDSLIDKGLDLAAQGQLTGMAYKEIRTQISNEAQSAFKSGDATLGQALKSVRGALDDAAKSSLSKADQEAWDTARAQWAAYKALTKGNVAEGGNLSAARLASVIRNQGDGLRTGSAKGPLADVARLGEAVKGVQNPNSGQLVQQMLYGNPFTGLPMMAGNKMAGALYNNPLIEKYMSGGVNIGQTGDLLLKKGGGLLGTPAIAGYLGAQ